MKLKICGMKYEDNILKVVNLQPDYMGFIFYEKSTRYVVNATPSLSGNIIKTGVFVNSTIAFIKKKILGHQLQAVQLHGNESVSFCKQLKEDMPTMELIKVFSVRDTFDFSILKSYEPYIDFFLFDTKGKLPGGNGYTFDWSILTKYPSEKPFFLSGGIGLETLPQLINFFKLPIAQKCYAIDVNSKFETTDGLKNIEQLKQFKTDLTSVEL